MESLIPHAAAIKGMAVLFVMAVVSMRDDRRRLVLGVGLAAAAVTAHAAGGGAGGIAFSLSGAALSFVFAAPLVVIGAVTAREVAPSLAAGALLGPAGAAVVYVVAFLFFAAQHVTRCGLPLCGERLAARYRLLFAAEPAGCVPAGDPAAGGAAGGAASRLFDWSSGTALAVLAALLVGVPL
ncbi:MAG: hypothetical protein JW876_10275 [Candidatus Krumholzibacteriota bacterium]|nr:hypothetical protein [Candidatus Krumholzibacteriota bacterium]